MERLQERGWRLGLRFDPLVYCEGYREQYRRLFAQVFEHLRAVERLYPDEPLLAGPFEESEGSIGYARELEGEMQRVCAEELLRHIPREIFIPSLSAPPVEPSPPQG